jgi:mannose-6-phosphate isomerase-like protein (cupin superfamily)
MQKIIKKPWGQEIILTEPDLPYTAKILSLKANTNLSLQYHDQKTETHTLISGQANLITDKTEPMVLHYGYTIMPGQTHRISALTDTLIFEASTPEQGTTVRLQDDYSRPNETK